jgi:hypothetical protein
MATAAHWHDIAGLMPADDAGTTLDNRLSSYSLVKVGIIVGVRNVAVLPQHGLTDLPMIARPRSMWRQLKYRCGAKSTTSEPAVMGFSLFEATLTDMRSGR